MAEKIFGKYPCEVQVKDPSLAQYVNLKPVGLPHSFARHANKQFAKRNVNIVERLANKLMRGGTGEKIGGKLVRTHGKLQGKKTKTLKVIESAFKLVEERTKQNPLQILVYALENSAPREEVTRVKFGGVSYQVAVDVSAQRRLDIALKHIALSAIMGAFDKKTTLAEALAGEMILAANRDANSYAIKRRNDLERMSKSAR